MDLKCLKVKQFFDVDNLFTNNGTRIECRSKCCNRKKNKKKFERNEIRCCCFLLKRMDKNT